MNIQTRKTAPLKTAFVAVASLGLFVAAGCDTSPGVDTVEPTVTTPDATTPDATTPGMTTPDTTVGNAADRTMDNAGNAMETASDKTAEGMNKAGNATENTIDNIQGGAGTTTRPAMQ